MALNYTPSTYVGEHFEEIFTDVLFGTPTITNKLVRFVPGIKYQESYTELTGGLTLQAYTPNRPTPSGNLKFGDKVVKNVKTTAYDEYDPNEIFRKTWFSKDLPAGVLNIESNKGNQAILARVIGDLQVKYEQLFWGGISAAQQTAIAAGGNAAYTTAGEKTYAAALTANAAGIDGVISKMILDLAYSPAAALATIVIPGTTLNATNIIAEIDKIYSAIPDAVLNNPTEMADSYIYAPYSVMRFINQNNISQTYRDKFTFVNGEYYYLGVKIVFVPMPTPNTMIFGDADDFIWQVDSLTDSENAIDIGPVERFSHIIGVRADFSQAAGVMTLSQKILYIA